MNYWEAQELACQILGLNYDELVDEGREDEIEEKLYEEYEIGVDQFWNIADELLKLTPSVESKMTRTLYNAFGVQEGDTWRAIAKAEIDKD